MKIKFNTVLILCLMGGGILQSSEILDFNELDVTVDKIKKEDKQFSTQGAISTKDGIQGNALSIDSTVRSIPGAYTQIDQSQGGVSVNIRGMTGFGRVNTMVDGVTQTFYGSATDSSFHGQIGTSSYTTNIDPNFLVGIDVTRGSFSKGQGGLMGSANLRTIGVSDVIRDERNFGFLGKYSYGTNSVGPSFMGSFAGRYNFNDNQTLGLLFGYSGQNISQNYKIGGGSYIGDTTIPYDSDDDGINDSFTEPSLNPSVLKNQPRSKLAKLEYKSDFLDTTLSYRNYKNNIAGRLIENNNYQLDFNYNPNEILDLNILLAYNVGTQLYNKDNTWGYHDVSGVKTKNKAFIFDINNTTYKEFSNDFNASLTYGYNYLSNKYTNDFPLDRVLLPYILTSFYPKGTQYLNSIYLDTKFTKDIFTLDANVDYTFSKISGHKGICYEGNIYCYPKKPSAINKKYQHFNYSFMLSADINPYFNPFISYSKTNRIPNVQEFFFTADADFYHNINTGLKAEIAKTFQIGFNTHKQNVLTNNDFLGFKALFYETRVKNYIYDRRYNKEGDGEPYVLQLNDNDISKFRGIELEFKYDLGYFYTKFAYTYQYSHHKFSDSESMEFGGAQSGQKQFAQLPKHYANLNIGARFFDEKLDIGANARYTSKATRIVPNGSLDDDPNDPNAYAPLKTSNELPQMPTIVDLYAGYEIFKGFKVRAEVQNLFDKNYMDALYTYNSGENQNIGGWLDPIFVFNNQARGRTFLFSFEYRY